MKYQVELTERAEQDVDHVLQWFRDESASASGERWFAQLMKKIGTLELRPDRCPIADESLEIGKEIRELTFGKRKGRYRILFRIDKNIVLILRIWHGARDAIPPDAL